MYKIKTVGKFLYLVLRVYFVTHNQFNVHIVVPPGIKACLENNQLLAASMPRHNFHIKFSYAVTAFQDKHDSFQMCSTDNYRTCRQHSNKLKH